MFSELLIYFQTTLFLIKLSPFLKLEIFRENTRPGKLSNDYTEKLQTGSKNIDLPRYPIWC